MDKSIEKRNKNNKYNAVVVAKVAEFYGYSRCYIRRCLKGERGGVMAENVVNKYNKIVKELEEAYENVMESNSKK